MERLLKEPAVFIVIGANMCVAVKLEYFVILLAAVLFSASPACENVSCMLISECMHDGHVPNERFPLDHGIRVAPSGRLPLLRKSPTGSLLDGVCVRKIAG